jgi:hypothetical protein
VSLGVKKWEEILEQVWEVTVVVALLVEGVRTAKYLLHQYRVHKDRAVPAPREELVLG